MIRHAELNDAKNIAALIQQVESESPFMLYGEGERALHADKQAEMIEVIAKQKNSAFFLAEINKKIVGYLIAIGGQARKNKHSAYVVIGILSEYQGQGNGTALFNKLEHWALNNGVNRLELTVITENISGIKLYEKAGFKREGVKRNSLYFDGKFVDEYYMSKLLEG